MSLSFSTLSTPTPVRTWDEASSPAAVRLARDFESAWRASAGRRPEPEDFLDEDCPGARLAILRAELSLRWEAGDRVSAEAYRRRYPDLDDETLVALVYEEFCLREEEQGAPDPAEYLARYPSLAPRLRRVFDIHGLVGSAPTTISYSAAGAAAAVPFPEAGQTIAGFHLVEELGRGAFARVFLARERQLADRPVALKVARTGTREPQTLARLQHTHIVPVYSYRTDPATGLHLLCMPYFSRLTLAQLLADPQVRVARSGADLVAALDRLGPVDGPPPGRSAGRAALARRDFAQAVAWWGARMAEALDHAHDRGVLHRDVKPSNVLVTVDGMPMLLDFNLARDAPREGSAAVSDALGGTLDYMSPEHLEELADGVPGRVDARSDVYSLGVLLYEALMGIRPFAPPRDALSPTEVLLRAADERRAGAPSLRDTHPEVPVAFEAVIRRCLAPEPEDRYPTAADLAADLQAVADDQPLRFAREPWPSRAVRWARRHRRALAMAAPVLLAMFLGAGVFLSTRLLRNQSEREVTLLIEAGRRADQEGDYGEAIARFEAASRLADARPFLQPLHKRARADLHLARQRAVARASADSLFHVGESLRFRLAGVAGNPAEAGLLLKARLEPFYVMANQDWSRLPELQLLDPAIRSRLIEEVDELLFLWALALDRVHDPQSVSLCDRALAFTANVGPWRALRARLVGAPQTEKREVAQAEGSSLACFEWGLLLEHEGRRPEALEWLRRSVELAEANGWRRAYFAWVAQQCGQPTIASPQAEAAVALRPQSPWARVVRARIALSHGDRDGAVKDYQEALHAQANHFDERDPAFERQVQRELDLLAF